MPEPRRFFKIPAVLKRQHFEKKPGEAPGTIKFTGQQVLDRVIMTLYDYGPEHFSTYDLSDIDDSRTYLESPSKTWINIAGLHDPNQLQEIWDYFDLHPLVREDIVNTNQRPKIEAYTGNMYFVARMLTFDKEKFDLNVEQVSMVLGKDYVLSFQESDFPVFGPVIDRLEKAAPRLRNNGPDYLAYALLDTIVDHYFTVLEAIGDEIEELEDIVLINNDAAVPSRIHALRRKLIFIRRSIWPLRDSLNNLLRDESPFIDEENKIFYRDVYDHLVQVLDGLENYRDMVIGLLDMYMSQVSNKMNEVMKVLTIIATIFIPLTFIAGIYGMNFDPEASPWNMPELSAYWGYPAVWAVMIITAFVMIVYFRKKDWL